MRYSEVGKYGKARIKRESSKNKRLTAARSCVMMTIGSLLTVAFYELGGLELCQQLMKTLQ